MMKTIMNLTAPVKSEDISMVASNQDVAKDTVIQNDEKILPVIKEDENCEEFSSKVCYDNPAFNANTVTNNENLNHNNVTKIYTPNNFTAINLQNGSAGDKISVPVSPPSERRSKARTYSMASVKSIRSFTNALQTDRRYSRRMSIVQRKCESLGHPDMPDNNPLRRKMSFIKDTSGEEPLGRATIQILLASLCAGFGNVGAGVIIDMMSEWRAFIDIKTMFILVPSLLGLKGNLEMTMASRLSTEANLGHMDRWPKTLKMIGGDMALVQCQATVISFLAAFVAIGIDLAKTQHIRLDHSLVLIASSVATANVACFILGMIMAFVIVFSNKVNIDPDNIATPIAASLGDVSTAGLFAISAECIYGHYMDRGSQSGLPTLAISTIVLFLVLLPVFYIIARKNSFTHELVHTGWTPVVTAMMISSGGGFFLDSAVDRYDKLPPFQPVICGVGGNLVAVAASKISTRLHMNAKLGTLPFGISRISSPLRVFYNRRDISTKLCLILFSMAIPLHLLYSVIIWGIQSEKIKITFLLISLYISFATLQVFILLFVGYNLVHLLWSYAMNPDMSAIPILTALGDLLGSAFLLIAFGILEKLNDPNAVIPIFDSLSTQAFNSTNFTIYSNLTS